MIMTTNNMTKLYDESKCAWSDDIKFDELVDHGGAARFLVVYERDARSKDARNPVGFVHFRFTLQGEPVGVEAGEPALYVMDIQLEESVRRRGLGKHLMTVIENIARQQGMMHILFPVVKEDRRARSFVLEGLSGYVAEHLEILSYDGKNPGEIFARDQSFLLFSKRLLSPRSEQASNAAASAVEDHLSAANTPQKPDRERPCGHANCSCSDHAQTSGASSEAAGGETLSSAFQFVLDMSRSITNRLRRPGGMAEALKNLK
mmetsp:Transcript_42509/g.133887  ORF Transcript_42509/g.133887 Transcript_42509/m.133887 type:complete len:261 (-) Transcript_42509:137-919(-)